MKLLIFAVVDGKANNFFCTVTDWLEKPSVIFTLNIHRKIKGKYTFKRVVQYTFIDMYTS